MRDAVADAGGEDVLALAVGIEQPARRRGSPPAPQAAPSAWPVCQAAVSAGVFLAISSATLLSRADRDEHRLAVRREDDVARPVAAAGAAAWARWSRPAPRAFRSPLLVGEADHRVGVRHIDPLRVRAGRVEGDAERAVRALRRRSRSSAGLAAPSAARSTRILPGIALGDEDVAVRRDAHLPRAVELGEFGRRVKPGRVFSSAPGRPRHHRRQRDAEVLIAAAAGRPA